MIVQIERKTKYYLIFSEMQPIFDLISGSKIRLNEQKCKRISIFFCFLECEYLRDKVSRIHKFPEYSKFTAIKKLQRHQLATLLPIGAFDSSDSPNATRMSSSEDPITTRLSLAWRVLFVYTPAKQSSPLFPPDLDDRYCHC